VKVFCPHCRSHVDAPRNVVVEHKAWRIGSREPTRCDGSGAPALSLAIAQAEREVTNIRTRIAATQALIAEYELSVADLSSDLAKSEATLAKLRKRAAKGGAK
jgi:hypothetical protein